MTNICQNVGPTADLATSLDRPLALRLPQKTPLIPSCAATAEHDWVMRRIDVASPFPSCNYYAARKHSVPHICILLRVTRCVKHIILVLKLGAGLVTCQFCAHCLA